MPTTTPKHPARPGRWRLRLPLLGALGLAAGVPAAVSLERGEPASPSAATQAATASASATAVGAATLEALRQNLNDAIGAPGRDSSEWSILAVSLDRGDTLFARGPDRSLAPASNIKLLTTAAALEHLGPGYRWATWVMADGPIRDGVLEGNLYLYGTGDPTLGTRFAERPAPALVALADSLAARGIREIRGDLVGDGSYFSGPNTGEGWPEDQLNAWYAAPSGALSVHENLVRVEAGGEGAAELSFVPGGEGIAIERQGGDGSFRAVREAYGGPVVVRGTPGKGSTSQAVLVGDPAMYAAALFRDVLEERGIALRGGVTATDHGAASPLADRKVFAPAFDEERPTPRVLVVHTSAPLQEILDVVNHRSHNFYADQVLRTVGRVMGGDGSFESGAAVVERLLARAGADTARVRVVDGCGLSPLNRVSAGDFVALLAHMAEAPAADAFAATLPIAGETRRFRRMGGTPAGGNLQAKTGTIDNVSALSGYVTAANGERIAFSIIANGLGSVGRGKSVENTIGVALAGFDRGGGAIAVGAGRP